MATLNVATASDLSNAIPQRWQEAVMFDADRQSIVGKLTGPDMSDAPVLEKEDLVKQKGDRINYVIYQRLIGAARTGTNALQGNEEQLVEATDVVTVGLFRHATAFNKTALKTALGDLEAVSGKTISGWLARFLDDNLVDQVLNQDTITTLYGGDATARGNVGPGDELTASTFNRLHMAAQRRGVKPWQTTGKARMPFPVYGAMVNEVDYYRLVVSDGFRQDFRLAAARGNGNPILDGNVDMYNGIVIYRWSSVHPGDGMLGSFLRPEGRVSDNPLSSSATTINIGANTAVSNVDYAQYLPDNAATHTLLIESEQITYTGAAASNPGNSSVTSVTRGANGTTAASHVRGSLITLNNIGKVLVFGSNFAMQAWAQRPKRVAQEYDYGYEIGRGIDFIYEVKGVEAADATLANCLAMEVYSPNPSTV